MLDKARALPADQVFLDLEDAVRAAGQAGRPQEHRRRAERGRLGRARSAWSGSTTGPRSGPTATSSRSSRAPARTSTASCCRRCRRAEQVVALDLLLTQIEKTMGFEVGRIGIEAQIENALGLINVDAIAAASPRVETIIFGPADFMASINMKSLVVGEQPPGYDVGDAYHYILMSILMAARAQRQAGDRRAVPADPRRRRVPPGRRPLGRARLRRQVGAAPRPDRRGQRGLLARRRTTTTTPSSSSTPTTTTPPRPGGKRGAAMLGDEMIDEASRKMALVISAKGRAAGHEPRDRWTPSGELRSRAHRSVTRYTHGGTTMARLAQTAGLTDVQQEILATVRDVRGQGDPPARHGARARGRVTRRRSSTGMKEMGLFGLTIPEEYGGLGESLLTYALVVEEIARGWMSVSGVINTHFIVAYMIAQHGTDEQKQRLPAADGRPARSAARSRCPSPTAARTSRRSRPRRVRDGDEFVLDGQKMWLTNGGTCRRGRDAGQDRRGRRVASTRT